MTINPLEHLGLVAYFARLHGARPPYQDSDQFADGCVGLLRAIQLYDPTRGVKFSTYASYHIRQQIQYARALERRRLKKAGLSATVCMSELDYVEGREIGPELEAEEADCKLGIKLKVERLLLFLDERSRDILVCRFLLDMTLVETGERHGITKERVRQLEVKALRKLRKLEALRGSGLRLVYAD